MSPGPSPGGADSALLETLVMEAPVAFAFYDADLRYRRINRMLAEINGVPMERHIGRRPSEVLPADLAAAIEAMLRRVLTTGEVVLGSDFSAEVPAGGGQLRYWQSSWYPARGADGRVDGVAVLVVDVTERRRGELALRVSQQRTVQLQEATAALATALSVEQVSRVVSAVGERGLGAVTTALALPDPGSPPSGGAGAAVRAWEGYAPGPVEAALAARVLATARATYVASPAELPAMLPGVDPAMAPAGVGSWAGLPLRAGHGGLGVLCVAFAAPGPLPDEDRVFLEALAGQCALAVERAQAFARERRIAQTLQQDLLPRRLPDVPGWELVARFLPSLQDASVGGDWYDAFPVPGGRLVLVLGDVMGRGLAAAAGMGRVRAAMRALALVDPEPVAVLTGLDRLFGATEEPEQITTVAYLLLDPATGLARVSDAGHLPALHVPPGGPPRLWNLGGLTTPLGCPEDRTAQELALAPGDTLVIFSDGLVEQRHWSIDTGLDLLLASAGVHGGDELGALLDALVDDLLGASHPGDDVALLGIRWLGEP
ncbi:MAG: SpoIIE family protein phosphatase [Actinomycetota bacterium]